MPLTTIQGTSLTLNPKTKEQLRALIDYLVGLEGVFCDLNHIDISGVDDFTELFYHVFRVKPLRSGRGCRAPLDFVMTNCVYYHP